jgi:hypothetical protein
MHGHGVDQSHSQLHTDEYSAMYNTACLYCHVQNLVEQTESYEARKEALIGPGELGTHPRCFGRIDQGGGARG